MKSKLGAGLFFLLIMIAHSAGAEVTQRDLQIAARALGFLDPPFSGETLMGIVFDPSDSRSSQQARDIIDMMGNGLDSGSVRLVPELVPLAEVGAARVDLYFLTEYINDAARSLHTQGLPCITVDMESVREGFCTMGIQSLPRIDIVVNREAAEAIGARFASVFRMMIREI